MELYLFASTVFVMLDSPNLCTNFNQFFLLLKVLGVAVLRINDKIMILSNDFQQILL